MPEVLTTQVRKLAAIGYGEASTDNNPQEVRAICFTVTNRMRAWQLADVDSLLKEAGAGYVVATKGNNVRYNQLMAASDAAINADQNMRSAVESARDALAQRGNDPSNGAYWWDGVDIKKSTNPDTLPGSTTAPPRTTSLVLRKSRCRRRSPIGRSSTKRPTQW